MGFEDLFNFLERLNANNKKEWMDANRKEYHQVRDWYISWLDKMNDQLAAIDPNYFNTPGKKAINRINNNLMFHPDKPVYKDHFGAGLDQVSKQGDFYIHLGISECLLASGYYHPDPKTLKKIREAIDYNGEELQKILNKKQFKKLFGGLAVYGEKLTNAPKGFSADHEFIELLKYKSFAVEYSLKKEDVLAPGFEETLIETYQELLPFRRYLNEAVSF